MYNTSKQVIGLFLVFFFLHSACSSQVNSEKIREVRININYPFLPINGDTVNEMLDTVWIQFKGNEVLYLLPAYKADYFNGELISMYRKAYYFFFNKDSLYGYYTENIDSTRKPARYKVDSMLGQRAFHNEYRTNRIRYVRTDTLDENRFIQRYAYDSDIDQAFDSVYYSYDRQLNHLPYSFARGLDSITGARMYKSELVFSNRYYIKHKRVLPRQVFMVQYSGTENTDPATFNKVRAWLQANGVDL